MSIAEMAQGHTLSKYGRNFFFTFYQLSTLNEEFCAIDESFWIIHLFVVEDEKSRILCAIVYVYPYFLHILELRIGFAQQIQVKAKLVEYKHENKLVF